MQRQRSLRQGQGAAHMHMRQQDRRAAAARLSVVLLLLSAAQHVGAQFLPAVDTVVQRAVRHADAVLRILQLPGKSAAHLAASSSCLLDF